MKNVLLVTLFLATILFSQDKISIIGVGDMMFGSHFPDSSRLHKNKDKLLANVTEILTDADVTFGNVEGVFLNEGNTTKDCYGKIERCFAFKMPEDYISILTDNGFDVVSIANNHVNDFGIKGQNKTVELLEQAKIHYAGLTKYPSTVFEKNGIKYGFAAFAPNYGCISLLKTKQAVEIVKQLEKVADIVIVSFHGGAEGEKYAHVSRDTEYYLGQNRGNIYNFAHAVIDAGADIVFGHGPHVTRAVELYKDRIIAYSLGNFCTYGRFNLDGIRGLAPILKVFVDKSGKFDSAKIFATRQTYYSPVKNDSKNRVIKEMQKLTSKDFPETNLVIKDDGTVVKKK